MTKFKWVEWADIIHLHWVNDYLDYPSFFKKNNMSRLMDILEFKAKAGVKIYILFGEGLFF